MRLVMMLLPGFARLSPELIPLGHLSQWSAWALGRPLLNSTLYS